MLCSIVMLFGLRYSIASSVPSIVCAKQCLAVGVGLGVGYIGLLKSGFYTPYIMNKRLFCSSSNTYIFTSNAFNWSHQWKYDTVQEILCLEILVGVRYAIFKIPIKCEVVNKQLILPYSKIIINDTVRNLPNHYIELIHNQINHEYVLTINYYNALTDSTNTDSMEAKLKYPTRLIARHNGVLKHDYMEYPMD